MADQEFGFVVIEPGAVVNETGAGTTKNIEAIDLQANLQEAWMAFEKGSAEALLVRRMTAPGIYRIYGILTRDTVERSYRA